MFDVRKLTTSRYQKIGTVNGDPRGYGRRIANFVPEQGIALGYSEDIALHTLQDGLAHPSGLLRPLLHVLTGSVSGWTNGENGAAATGATTAALQDFKTNACRAARAGVRYMAGRVQPVELYLCYFGPSPNRMKRTFVWNCW
jgi:hypothetical protein